MLYPAELQNHVKTCFYYYTLVANNQGVFLRGCQKVSRKFRDLLIFDEGGYLSNLHEHCIFELLYFFRALS